MTADEPVLIASVPCINIPQDKQACDHIEETVLPAETLGKHYIVTPPGAPHLRPLTSSTRFEHAPVLVDDARLSVMLIDIVIAYALPASSSRQLTLVDPFRRRPRA